MADGGGWEEFIQKPFGFLFGRMPMVVVYGIIFYKVVKHIKQLKYLEYDDSNLYVKHHDYEVQIPYEQIKEVSIVSIDGLYKFVFYKANQFGEFVLCKPSLWYPFNYPRIDDELNRIRAMIDKRKREVLNAIEGESSPQLSSMNL